MSKSVVLIAGDLTPLRRQLPGLLEEYPGGRVACFTESPFLIQVCSPLRSYVEAVDFSEPSLAAEDYATNELLDAETRLMSSSADLLLVYYNDELYLQQVASYVGRHVVGLDQIFVDDDDGRVVRAQVLFKCDP